MAGAALDHAVRAGYPSVRIIHGIGSGALKRAVTDYLSNSSYCAGFRAAEAPLTVRSARRRLSTSEADVVEAGTWVTIRCGVSC